MGRLFSNSQYEPCHSRKSIETVCETALFCRSNPLFSEEIASQSVLAMTY